MDEIVAQVSAKTGLPAESVRDVLRTAADILVQKLPPHYGSFLNDYLNRVGDAGARPTDGPIGAALFGPAK